MNLGRSWDRSPFVSAGPGLPLDQVAGAAAAYSTRLLRSAYAGKSLQVRRSSDSLTQDIGFVSGVFDATSFTTFIGANTAFDTIFYDQANSNDEVQATTANQLFVNTALSFYGIQSPQGDIRFSAAPDAPSIQDVFNSGGLCMVVLSCTGNGFVNSIISKGTWLLFAYPAGSGGGGVSQVYWVVKGTTGNGSWPSDQTFTANTKHIITVEWNASTPAVSPVVAVDGTTYTSTGFTPLGGTVVSDVGSALEFSNDAFLGSNNTAFGGTIYEAMLFKGAVSAPNKALLLANAKSFYGIP